MTADVRVTIDPDLKLRSILRRYLDLPKYLDLLKTSSIYFSRVDNFPDRFEGALPPSIRQAINEAHAGKEVDYDADAFIKKLRESIYLNCWSLLRPTTTWRSGSSTATQPTE